MPRKRRQGGAFLLSVKRTQPDFDMAWPSPTIVCETALVCASR
ncbi:hypothetical protein AFE_1224 [Acidithiobacillus ferrooxidans ATCC 23270]|uniref:Uncharacterized protein n=1 Tax=Acidithiobacillus ferrooxidans (strain ATCC 23270 / DSM 14882 / CIP 104768 / NCIMB 8455) TaxID=243159 RepID=B7J8Q5_ACIF2|nr:hypothetical protein AFE_1224 [Acidithiobacillus ferrooxidans ATCC 23270]